MQGQHSDSAVSNWLHSAALSNAGECCWSSYSMKIWTICSVWTRPWTALMYHICQISLTAFPATSYQKITGFPWCRNHSYQSEWRITCVSRQVTHLSSHYHISLKFLTHFRTLSGRFWPFGIISLWTQLGASIPILLPCTVTKCRSLYPITSNFSPDWLSFSLDISILTVPAYCHMPAFIVTPGSVSHTDIILPCVLPTALTSVRYDLLSWFCGIVNKSLQLLFSVKCLILAMTTLLVMVL